MTDLSKLTEIERGAYLANLTYLQATDKIKQLKRQRSALVMGHYFSSNGGSQALIEQAFTKNTDELEEFAKQGFTVWGVSSDRRKQR